MSKSGVGPLLSIFYFPIRIPVVDSFKLLLFYSFDLKKGWGSGEEIPLSCWMQKVPKETKSLFSYFNADSD